VTASPCTGRPSERACFSTAGGSAKRCKPSQGRRNFVAARMPRHRDTGPVSYKSHRQ
jgi:hypothetical protein